MWYISFKNYILPEPLTRRIIITDGHFLVNVVEEITIAVRIYHAWRELPGLYRIESRGHVVMTSSTVTPTVVGPFPLPAFVSWVPTVLV